MTGGLVFMLGLRRLRMAGNAWRLFGLDRKRHLHQLLLPRGCRPTPLIIIGPLACMGVLMQLALTGHRKHAAVLAILCPWICLFCAGLKETALMRITKQIWIVINKKMLIA